MLTIRPDQLQTLSELMLKQFEDRMVTHLRAMYPDATQAKPEAELRRLIQEGIVRARGYQVKTENNVRRYLECMVSYGTRFDSGPETAWAGKILRDAKLTGTQKMDRIANYEVFALKGGV